MTGEIDPDEVKRRRSDLDVVDIRDANAYADGHIPDAENVPLDELEDVVDAREWGDEVVVACYIGESSVQAARFVDHYVDGEVASMAGGYEEWDGDVVEDASPD
jgi:thiosulfate sulfurtransferase